MITYCGLETMKDRHILHFSKRRSKYENSFQSLVKSFCDTFKICIYQIENNTEIKYSLISVLRVSAAAGGLGSFLMSVLASAVLSFDDFFSLLSSSEEDELESSVKASLIAEKSSASGALFPSVKT